MDGGRPAIALRMPFAAGMAGWWWLHWRFHDTLIPLAELDAALHGAAGQTRRWLRIAECASLEERKGKWLALTETVSIQGISAPARPRQPGSRRGIDRRDLASIVSGVKKSYNNFLLLLSKYRLT